MLNVPQEIKDLLHRDTCPKNIRIHFPNGERTDICNNLIVKDSVSFKESINSQDTLKFGLCEASVFECETVGVENIKGAQIEVFCEIYCDATVEGAIWQIDLERHVYQIPYGVFVVDSCERQADMIHRKIVGYSFLYYKESLEPKISLGEYWSDSIVNDSAPYVMPVESLVYERYPDFFDMSAYELTPYTISESSTSDFYQILKTWDMSGYTYILRADRVKEGGTRYTPGTQDEKPSFFNTDDFNIEENLMANLQDILDVSMNYGMPETSLSEFLKILDYHKIYPPRARPGRNHAVVTYINMYGKIFATKRVPFSPAVVFFSIVKVRNQQYYGVHDFGWVRILKENNITAYFVTNINNNITISLPREYVTGYEQIWSYSGYTYKKAYDEIDFIKMFNAVLELQGLIGAYSREGMKILDLKKLFLLNPDENLYPGSTVYPQGAKGGKLLPEDYQTCWYDDAYALQFGLVYCTFKTIQNNREVDGEYRLYFNGFDENSNPREYQTYKIENNAVISAKTWTLAEIGAICTTIASNLEGVSYMPVKFKGRGLPYVESGDTFEILTRSNDSITTIVMNRTITGEQTLTDSYESV